MYKINAIPIKNQQHSFTEQVILKFLQNYRKPQLHKVMLKRTKLEVLYALISNHITNIY